MSESVLDTSGHWASRKVRALSTLENITPEPVYILVMPDLGVPFGKGEIDGRFTIVLEEGASWHEYEHDLFKYTPAGCIYTWATAAGLDPHNLAATPELYEYVTQPAHQELTPPWLIPTKWRAKALRRLTLHRPPTLVRGPIFNPDSPNPWAP